jgi:microcystin-dependent protein
MVMKFFKMMLPFVAVVGEYFTKTGRIGYDANTNTVKYKTPSGVKEIATTEQVGGGGVTPQWFVGQVVQSLNNVVPNGFKRLDGQQLLKSQYPDLYAVIGDNYDNGSVYPENFRLPDFTKITMVGAIDIDFASTNPFAVGALGGNATIGLEHLPEIKPTFNIGDAAFNSDFTNGFIGQGDIFSQTKVGETDSFVNTVGNEYPEPFLQPYIAVNMLVFTGVYV